MTYQRLHYPHKGIVSREQFARQVDLRCYRPSADLAPFVELYFVARWDRPGQPDYMATDILTKPVVNLFFTQHEAVISGVSRGVRTFEIGEKGLYAGIKFRSGGFRPFYDGPVIEIMNTSLPVSDVFKRADLSFVPRLQQIAKDEEIVHFIEEMLRSARPQVDEKVELATRIVTYIENSDHSVTPTEIKDHFHMSERGLQYLFSEYVGAGVKWTMMRSRLIKALQKPLETAKPNWTEVAAELNYSTQSHFINDFRRILGISPSKYAKLIASESD